ncbi:hypothetical protein ACH5RR_000738 [Cinchona calisaya]|uniref:Uncharacterized protein n=1 Tax=Cinchona calisaya TaxID=153742 RepID=A0ABD3B2L6_9GENT
MSEIERCNNGVGGKKHRKEYYVVIKNVPSTSTTAFKDCNSLVFPLSRYEHSQNAQTCSSITNLSLCEMIIVLMIFHKFISMNSTANHWLAFPFLCWFLVLLDIDVWLVVKCWTCFFVLECYLSFNKTLFFLIN